MTIVQAKKALDIAKDTTQRSLVQLIMRNAC
jgi:hypothetical protein